MLRGPEACQFTQTGHHGDATNVLGLFLQKRDLDFDALRIHWLQNTIKSNTLRLITPGLFLLTFPSH